MDWVQVYDPLGHALLSSLVAGLPIIVLLGLLVFEVSAPRAAMAGLAVALAVAIGVFGMPASAALAAAAYGGCFGLLPIGWIVLSAVFLFHLTVRSGQFEIVKQSVTGISPDRRIQALLIGFCFGSFLEGAAGFGTPVAICAALLIGIGFPPLYAAGLSLLANTSPVAFGGLGTPIITLAAVCGLAKTPADLPRVEMLLSQTAGRQLSLFSLIIPVWIVLVLAGRKGLKGCWPAVLVCGGTYAAIQFVLSNFHGPGLVNVLGGAGSMAAMVLLLQFWHPAETWRFPGERVAAASPGDCPNFRDHAAHGQSENGTGYPLGAFATASTPRPTGRQMAYAWMPWLILSLMIFFWGWPAWKKTLDGGTPDHPSALAGISKVSLPVPGLDKRVYRSSPVVEVPPGMVHAEKPEAAVYQLTWLSATGTSIFLAAVLAAFWLRIGARGFFLQLGDTLLRVRWALLTIVCMLALAFVTKYSGADATLGLAFTRTGWLYPFFAPLLGWLGVALTGSDTSANALFGSLQRITAEQLKLNPTLIVASNSTGGVMGKMIDAQSIVVAATATEQAGGEGPILRFVFLHSLALAILVGFLTLAQAYLLQWTVP
jgi:lactate permease